MLYGRTQKMLYGRTHEVAVIDELIGRGRAGLSSALVIRGEAGIGKTTLLDHAARTAGLRVLRGYGVESETHLPFAGLHLLLRGHTERISGLAAPQAHALEAALGQGSAGGGDRFLVGLAVLTLLSDIAGDEPLLCLVDDSHWLDHGTAEALLFAARRLDAEGIVLLFSARDLHAPDFPATGLADLRLQRLDDPAADDLLAARAADLPSHVRREIMSQAKGNPLALEEFAESYREGRRHPGLPTHSRIKQTFADRIDALPVTTRTMLLIAAADATGELAAILNAGRRIGGELADLDPAEQRRLISISDGQVEFRHPLIRAAVYEHAPHTLRLAAHRSLAATFAEQRNICQNAWHLAAAATGPDEEVAAALDRSAEADRVLGGFASAAAALERAAALSLDPVARVRRLTAAADAAVTSGQYEWAVSLANSIGAADVGADDAARLAMIRATLAGDRNEPMETYRELTAGARRLAGHAPETALYMLFWAAESAWLSGDVAAVSSVEELARSLGLSDTDQLRLLSRVSAGLNTADGSGMADGMAALRALSRAGAAIGARNDRDRIPLLRATVTIAGWHLMLGEHDNAHRIATETTRACRQQGAIGVLPYSLSLLAQTQFWRGSIREAAVSGEEGQQIAADSRQPGATGALAGALARLAAMAGDEHRCSTLLTTAQELGTPAVLAQARGAYGLLELGLGRPASAVEHLSEALSTPNRIDAIHALPDLVEAAVRMAAPHRAVAFLRWYEQWAEHSEQHWAQAVAMRCRAQLAGNERETADQLAAAVDLHRSDGTHPFEAARTELLYGELLRRTRRRSAAQVALRAALRVFDHLGAQPWVTRAQSELRAAGDAVAPTKKAPPTLLTPQELRVAQLAARGMSNREIAAQLFISPRTVSYHLYKAYPKLGVASRAALATLDLNADIMPA